MVKLRNKEYSAVRDNVVFELGLFIGRLGKERNFIIVPRGHEKLHIPSDLLALTTATFDPARSDSNLIAALGSACSKIRKQLVEQGQFVPAKAAPLGEDYAYEDYDDNDIVGILQSWMGHRSSSENTAVIHYDQTDREL